MYSSLFQYTCLFFIAFKIYPCLSTVIASEQFQKRLFPATWKWIKGGRKLCMKDGSKQEKLNSIIILLLHVWRFYYTRSQVLLSSYFSCFFACLDNFCRAVFTWLCSIFLWSFLAWKCPRQFLRFSMSFLIVSSLLSISLYDCGFLLFSAVSYQFCSLFGAGLSPPSLSLSPSLPRSPFWNVCEWESDLRVWDWSERVRDRYREGGRGMRREAETIKKSRGSYEEVEIYEQS